ncbi:hypothetical protein MMPV_001024 [Pyropia vietnamensis]
MADIDGPAPETAVVEGATAVSLARVLGPIPNFDNVTAWEVIWGRERARGWTAQTRAHQLMVDVDATYPGNTLRKQLALCPRALAPSVRDRCTAQTFLRHASEIGYVSFFRTQAGSVEMANIPWGPQISFLIREGPFLGGPEELVSYSALASARHQRDRTGFFVPWHQAEFPSMPSTRRDRHYVRAPRWWGSVEVPYGALVELPPVVTYFRDRLIDGDAFSWPVFITEWTVATGAFLVEEYRRAQRLWLYPRRLAGWIRQFDSRHFCRGPDGLDEAAERELRALLDLLDLLNEEPGLSSRMVQLAGSSRERAGVAEDLSPLEVPYTDDVQRHRSSAGSYRRQSEVRALEAAPPGSTYAGPSGPASASPTAPRLMPPPPPRSRPTPTEEPPLVLVSNLAGHDIPASLLASLSSPLSPSVSAGLIPFLGYGDVDEPAPRVGSVQP